MFGLPRPPAPEGWDKDVGVNTTHLHNLLTVYTHLAYSLLASPGWSIIFISLLVLTRVVIAGTLLYLCSGPRPLAPRPRRVEIKTINTTQHTHSTLLHSASTQYLSSTPLLTLYADIIYSSSAVQLSFLPSGSWSRPSPPGPGGLG